MPSGVFAAHAVATAIFLAAPAPVPHARQVLHDQCLLQAADPKNPWALAHGITGIGASFLAADGRKASEVIVKDFLQRNLLPDGGPGVGSPFGFERYAPDGTPIEPHSNLITKTFVMAGLPMTTKFATSWGQVTLQQLVDSVKKGFRHVPNQEEYWRDAAWTLDTLSYTTKPGTKLKLADGSDVSIDTVMDDGLGYLETANADLKAGMLKGLPQVDKRKQGIYGHSCGGLHLVQAVLGWARNPEVRKRWGPRVDDQIAVLLYRLESERRQYEAALQQAPQYKLQILTQMVKFYGHFLETTARLKTELQWKPTDAQLQTVTKAKALLDATVRELEAAKTFEQMESLKSSQRQVYLDLIGDSCHATHGLDGWP